MRSFKIYDFTLSAGGAMPLLVEGGYFKIYSCTGVLAVSIDGGSTIGPINTGQGMKTEFKRLTIVDQSGAANVGKIIVASDEFVDGRISGEVSVIDGEKARTLAGQMMMASISQGAVAGQLPHCQLWNSSATKNLIVMQLSLMSTSLIQFQLGFYNAALTADNSATQLLNKKQGLAVGVGQARSMTSAAALFAVTGQSVYALASQSQPWPIKGAIVVPASQGLTCFGNLANASMVMNCEWYEEAI